MFAPPNIFIGGGGGDSPPPPPRIDASGQYLCREVSGGTISNSVDKGNFNERTPIKKN